MPRPKGWDLTKGKLSINGIPIVGFKKGDHIVATYNQDRTTTHMSADGYGQSSTSPNRDGEVTIGLHKSSPALTTIQGLVTAGQPLVIDYIDYTSVGAFFHTDDGLIKKEPDFMRSDEVGDIDWVFVFTQGDIQHGTAIQE